MRRAMWAALTCGLMVVMAGCGRKSTEVTLKISSWGDVQENAILTDLVGAFEKANPGVHVELQRTPYNEYLTKLMTRIASGDAPDVIFTEVGEFTDLYLKNVLEPLDGYVKASGMDLKAYYPQVTERFTINGSIYAIPRDTAPICVVYYNKKAFDEAGLSYPTDDWTLAEFLKDAQAVKRVDAKGHVTRWGLVDDWVMPEAWIYDLGGSYVDDVKRPTRWTFATDPNSLKGVQFRADLIHRYKVMVPPSGVQGMGGLGSTGMFETGTSAMFLSGIWKTPAFRGIKDFPWDVVMLPKGPAGTRAFSTGGSGYGIMGNSKHKQEAWRLVQFLSGEEGAKKFASSGFAQPALMSVANSPVFLDNQAPLNKKMLLKAVEYVKFPPVCANWREAVESFIGPELDKVWNGTETVEKAMSNLKPVLEKNPPRLK
jgi:multiple sugar transport system substrate-binding protein